MTLSINPHMSEQEQLNILAKDLKDYSDDELLVLWEQAQKMRGQKSNIPGPIAHSISMTMEVALLRELNLRRCTENRLIESNPNLVNIQILPFM